MPKSLFRKLPGFGLPLALSLAVSAAAQDLKPAITLEQQPSSEIAAAPLSAQEKSAFSNPSVKLPENFHVFKSIRIGESGYLEPLTLHFEATAKLTGIESTPDFKVEPGGSCVEGNTYTVNSTCSLLVRFTPSGPGARSGKLTITHSASAKPMYVGLGGYGSGPIVSFTPAVISTVPTSYPSSKGLFNGAHNLFVDGGDTLYVADTGNNVIRSMDSSGNFTTISTGTLNAPVGIAADSFGEVFFDEPNSGLLFEIFDYGYTVQLSGSGYPTCSVASPCKMDSTSLDSPGQMAIDSSNQLFFANDAGGAAVSQVDPYPVTYAPLTDPFTFVTSESGAFTIDAYDDLYSAYLYGSAQCAIVSQTYSNAVNGSEVAQKFAGGKTCGFAGDGGQARNAEISGTISQMAFDIAGNLYFTDAGNQRVRRIDASTGIITTIAGTGTVGYSGDGGPATKAALSSPTGVGVDSQGQVYILSGAAATGTSQVMRKVGPNGFLAFGNQLKGTASAALPVTVANTGNAELEWTNVLIEGANASDFSIDPTTTSCFLTSGSTLQAGESCRIGILFKPVASGSRSASLVFIDNTVTNSNTVLLSGSGTLPVPTVTITAPAAGATETAGTAFPFSVTVTSTTSPAPTGTVKFTVNGTAVGNPVTLASGAASISLTETTAGSYAVAATYSGDANYAASGPVSRTITVVAASKAASTATLKAKTNPATTCEVVAFSVAVASKTAVLPTGKVELVEGTKVLATGTVSNGSVTVMAPKLAAGAHVLQADYLGDSKHAASSSPALKETVAAATCAAAPKLPRLSLEPPPIR
jgi:hypothetical protein